MSYKYTVLQDKPICFYLLDEVRSATVGSYTSLSQMFSTYADLRDNGVSYSALSGLPVYDYSGNGNDGYGINSYPEEVLPLISGGVRGTKIGPDTIVGFNVPGIANLYYADNSFSIEAWALLPNPSSAKITIVGDSNNSIGIFYLNENIIFQVGSNVVKYKINNKQSVHIVGQFSSNKIELYINGVLVSYKLIDKYLFLNQDVNFQSGDSNNIFIIDAVAFYKYNMSASQILKHYKEGIKEINVSQIVHNDNGYLFSMNTALMKPVFKYSYPKSKSWKNFINENIKLSGDEAYLYFDETLGGNFSFSDAILIPSTLNITSSQIYWNSDVSNITVEVSIDAESWQECQNGYPLPFFNKNDNQISDILYLRCSMVSSNTSDDLPILSNINIDFFNNKDFYCDNFGYYISSDYDYALPNKNSNILSYNYNNGLRMYDGHGFTVNSDLDTKTIEMIFTPQEGQNVLFSAPSHTYAWDQNGVISKQSVSAIYVNGVNKTSATNISEFFTIGLPHHVVVVLSSPIPGVIKFNQNQDDSTYGLGHMYNNLAIYNSQFTQYDVNRHYLLYTDNITASVSDSLVSISESQSGTDSTPYLVISVSPDAVSI